MNPDAVARYVANSIHMGLFWVLSGEQEPAQRSNGDGGHAVEELMALLASVTPVVDPDFTELTTLAAASVASGTTAVTIPLRDAGGTTVASVSFRWTAEPRGHPDYPHVRTIISASQSLTADRQPQRQPDTAGRLPREQFVGSARLRVARLFGARSGRFSDLTRGYPLDDCEAAFFLQYADATSTTAASTSSIGTRRETSRRTSPTSPSASAPTAKVPQYERPTSYSPGSSCTIASLDKSGWTHSPSATRS